MVSGLASLHSQFKPCWGLGFTTHPWKLIVKASQTTLFIVLFHLSDGRMGFEEDFDSCFWQVSYSCKDFPFLIPTPSHWIVSSLFQSLSSLAIVTHRCLSFFRKDMMKWLNPNSSMVPITQPLVMFSSTSPELVSIYLLSYWLWLCWSKYRNFPLFGFVSIKCVLRQLHSVNNGHSCGMSVDETQALLSTLHVCYK